MNTEEIIEKIGTWVRYWEEQHGEGPRPPDVDHSALLRRLLEGKDPIPFIPPLSYSYPNYELAEGKVQLVHASAFDAVMKGTVVIDQSVWDIHEKISDTHYIVKNDRCPEQLFELKRLPPEETKHEFHGWTLVMLQEE